jgi:DUF2075 family protein
MTSFSIERLVLDAGEIEHLSQTDGRAMNWPVVYTLSNEGVGDETVYVGESLRVGSRLAQHLGSREKQELKTVRVILDKTFNKSACLDLESSLIQLFSGDGKYRVLNRNDGIVNADYYDRGKYQRTFDAIFEELRDSGAFTRSIPEIHNSDLFKLSPFKALNHEQAIAVDGITEHLLSDLRRHKTGTLVVQGDPGTGKTIVAIYLIKMLRDIAVMVPGDELDADSMFADFFTEENKDLVNGLRIGFVVPQQSLRKSIQGVFAKTYGLSKAMVLTPFDVGRSDETFDVIVVDETHRLNRRANQSSGKANSNFREINERLFGRDDIHLTQLDWIMAQSRHQIFFVDPAQSVRPADLSISVQRELLENAKMENRFYPLSSQMRVKGGEDYIDYVRMIFNTRRYSLPQRRRFHGYELRMFDDLSVMHAVIREQDARVGLARLVAGYAWRWISKGDKSAYDIVLDGCRLRWNSTDTDWINSPGSVDEVGSIHTVQGYDLNYSGVIIGPDLSFDASNNRLTFQRDNYFDKKGMENNRVLNISFSDEDMLGFITNIYSVLMTRGMLGTYVYVCDPALREWLRNFIPTEVS